MRKQTNKQTKKSKRKEKKEKKKKKRKKEKYENSVLPFGYILSFVSELQVLQTVSSMIELHMPQLEMCCYHCRCLTRLTICIKIKALTTFCFDMFRP